MKPPTTRPLFWKSLSAADFNAFVSADYAKPLCSVSQLQLERAHSNQISPYTRKRP